MPFKPMLASKVVPEKLKFPVYVQPKLDGIRASVVDGRLLTRSLKEVQNKEIQEALGRPEYNGLDGELLVGEPTDTDLYRKTCSFVKSRSKTGEPWTYYIFDKWDTDLDYMSRMNMLRLLENDLPGVHLRAELVYSIEELNAAESKYIEQGYEGAIVRDPNGLYKFGRASANSGQLGKLKRYEDSEAIVIGVQEELHNANETTTNELGRTARSSHKAGKIGKGTLGALHVRDIHTGVEFYLGTGFSAENRRVYWTNRGGLKGQIAKYKYFPVGVKDLPRHPVFLGWRLAEDM